MELGCPLIGFLRADRPKKGAQEPRSEMASVSWALLDHWQGPPLLELALGQASALVVGWRFRARGQGLFWRTVSGTGGCLGLPVASFLEGSAALGREVLETPWECVPQSQSLVLSQNPQGSPVFKAGAQVPAAAKNRPPLTPPALGAMLPRSPCALCDMLRLCVPVGEALLPSSGSSFLSKALP